MIWHVWWRKAFESTATKDDVAQLDGRLDTVDRRLEGVDQRLDRIENILIRKHDNHIDELRDRIRVIETKVGV